MIRDIFEALFKPNSAKEVERRMGGPYFVSWGGDVNDGEDEFDSKSEAISEAVHAFYKNAEDYDYYVATVMRGSPDPGEGVLVFMCQSTDLESLGWDDVAPGISAYKYIGKK